jgi:hypothetical protein
LTKITVSVAWPPIRRPTLIAPSVFVRSCAVVIDG